jgi:subtilisin family serine protease
MMSHPVLCCARATAGRALSSLAVLALVVLPLSAAEPAWKASADQRRHELLAQMGADRWQAVGYRGHGVKIAVLDTGFRGYRDHLGKALPPSVTVHSFRADGNLEAKDSQHGILCGEVIHAIAPEAELLFANWDIDREDEFLAAARWARQQGARILSISIVKPAWSDGQGGGEIHRQLAQILGLGHAPGDLLCFASAGNTTERHWGGVFHDAGDGFQEWKRGVRDNGVSPWGSEQCSVELYGHTGADYDLFVYDAGTNQEVGHAHTDHRGDRDSAVVYFQPHDGHTYRARVRHVRGPGGMFHLCTMESSLEYTAARASVCFPADGPSVIAMGAEDAGSGHKTWYSACGPNSSQPKPDFLATVPFPSLWRQRPFAGTSAAAPQGSALAALYLSRYPNWTPDQVRAALRSTARDLETPGPDLETGYGLLRLPRP